MPNTRFTTPFGQRCGIPDCPRPRQDDSPLCEEHLRLGYLSDYREWQALIEEGHGRYQAAVMCGLQDPHEANEE